ncbi:MAG: FkbM family methyltransferase [Gammaproteobacteria bacterium]
MTGLAAKARKLAGILAVPAWRAALRRHRVAAGVEHARVLSNLGGVQSVVDIGANRGQFGLVARHCFPRALVYSFEPLKAPGATFEKLFSRDGLTRLFPYAVGPETGEREIHISARDDSSSLLPITDRQDKLFPGTAEQGREMIRVVRLNDCLSEDDLSGPALLKLDVQGFELEALQGSEELLGCFQLVYVECSFVELYEGQALADEVIAWLRDRGFKLSGVYNMAYDLDGRAIQADFLFDREQANPSA